jgi:predicted PurR-regulated permease PerM
LPVEGGTSLSAAGLFGFGAAVLLTGNNCIQPALIGGTAQLPFLPVLIGILGGIESFGWVGPFPRAGNHGGSADHMARMDRRRD